MKTPRGASQRSGRKRPLALSEELARKLGGARRGAVAAGRAVNADKPPVPPLGQQLSGWLRSHREVFRHSLERLVRAPFGFALTAAVLGVAMALPAALWVLIANVGPVDGQWEGAARIALYLRHDADDQRAEALAAELAQSPDIAHIKVISRAEALAEFRAYSGFGEALDALGGNPLPPVLMIRAQEERSRASVEDLVANLRSLEDVAMATYDLAWMERLFSLADLARRLLWTLSALLALAVLLIVGNTIRLDILNRREEIEVVKLVGGTAAFIRRPFLYSGLWYGVAGGLLAWGLVELARLGLAAPVDRLAQSYGAAFQMEGLGATGLLALLGCGVSLGLLGSWLAVLMHVQKIEPA